MSKNKVVPKFDRTTDAAGDCPGKPDSELLSQGSPTQEPEIDDVHTERMDADTIHQANQNKGTNNEKQYARH
jgi:hypothetical protein